MIEKGELITLENGKEYICYSALKYKNNNYVYLISNFKPLEIKFAKQTLANEQIRIEIVTNTNEKKELLSLFQYSESNK